VGLHRRFECAHEPATDQTRARRSTPPAAARPRAFGGRLHRAQVHAVAGGKVVEALRDAPRAWLGAPGSLCLGQTADECAGIVLCRVQGFFQRLNVRKTVRLHDSIP
jgi:hypothetical protein